MFRFHKPMVDQMLIHARHLDSPSVSSPAFHPHFVPTTTKRGPSTLIVALQRFSMAQILAPIVQSTGSITMLHSSPDAFQNQQTQSHHPQPRSSQMPRSQIYNSQTAGTGYRGTSAPIAPYAFSSTPQLRQENRSMSAPNAQSLQQLAQPVIPTRMGHPTHPSSSSDSTTSTSGSSSRSLAGTQFPSKDNSNLGSEPRKTGTETTSASAITFSTSIPDLSFSLSETLVKPSPDRYRRGTRRTDSSTSGTASSSTPTPTQQSPSIGASTTSAASKLNKAPSLHVVDFKAPARPGHGRASSVDDMQLTRAEASFDSSKRYRRRSMSGLDMSSNAPPTAVVSSAPITPPAKRPTEEFRPTNSNRQAPRPSSGHGHQRQGSAGSASSGVSNRPTSSRQEPSPLRASAAATPNTSSKSAPEPARRIAPSPLSNPVSSTDPTNPANKAFVPSPAVQQLTALNDAPAKGVKSRLRRAFSFGSAAELRRATAENSLSAERARLRKDRYQTEDDAEQAAIVAKQEAAGIGAGIYSGQGGFTSSTDNISISSTASSASIMLRKMGNGVKKGSRSIKGLFRPKSVIGVPAADGPITRPSVGQVSMVTVEAERQKVNVNVDPHEQVGGGTGYPKLELNSSEAAPSTDSSSPLAVPANDSSTRKSIMGGDRERAEVLSSIKKGILKRRGTASDVSSPAVRPADIVHQHGTPKFGDASTSNNDHAPQLSVNVHGDDYFARPSRLLSPSTRSLPNTPNGGSRNISFSPRIQCHEAHSASDYDRRGEISTCNRLTPMLAQQIKEELNTFKMEMEVHELSKPHTHFF
ncbi:hypothetical protein K504DRAFT_511096 [Pleomassaria siparia CBS 279.74]|uniref:Protein BNI4 n=1 Tax=Pleomassaria siparia CBS 279.74 TaxID=1314801 RepID=A0A6G1KS27_9PLEO|nr:hypothetical protein K504DRAFT_511096 [Pleomassaria siparia CBS 279.74]